MNPKEFYSNYQADNEISVLSDFLVSEVLKNNPNSVLEFGCGTGKNLKLIRDRQHTIARSNIKLFGIDISTINVLHASIKNNLHYVALGDEDWLSKLTGMDVVFTCSVLDHIEDIEDIIKEFKRIGKNIYLGETNDKPDDFYYPHEYESYGFERTSFKWISPHDNATYYIWKLNQNIINLV